MLNFQIHPSAFIIQPSAIRASLRRLLRGGCYGLGVLNFHPLSFSLRQLEPPHVGCYGGGRGGEC
jgi:hypothetical protein